MVFGTGDWHRVDSPSGGEAYVNPNVSTDMPSIEEAASLTPGEVESEGWDTIVDSLSAPEASGVERVGIDFDNGVVDVKDSSGRSTYVLAAVGDSGEFSVIDDSGNVSTSEISAMPLRHHVAITEAVLGNVEFETDANEMSLGFKDSYTDMYTDMMRSGQYEALGGDVVFDFDSVKGAKEFSGNEEQAESLFERLDDIAEFYRDFHDEYSHASEQVDPDIPVTPEKYATDNGYKFRITSDSMANIVISNEFEEDPIELDVVAFGDHQSRTRLY